MTEDGKALLEWVEKTAIENMKAQHGCADILAKDAATTLTVFLAGMAGGLTYSAKALDTGTWNWFSIGAGAFSAWFLVLSVLLVLKCLKVDAIPSIYNEPRNLYQPTYSLGDLKEAELRGIQQRIDASVARNAKVANWLNKLRLGAAASPAVFILSALVVKWVG